MSAPKDTLLFTDLLLAMAGKLPRVEAIKAAVEQLESLENSTPISIGSILEDNARTYRDRPAIFFEDLSLTHFEFNELVNQYANYFLSIGISKGTVAVVFLENRFATVLLIAALAKIGAIASLINANQRGKVLKHSIETDQGPIFLVGEERMEAWEEVQPLLQLPGDNTYIWIRNTPEATCPAGFIPLKAKIRDASRENPAITREITLGDRFANVFTSGTTGMPKASIQTHRKWYVCYLWYGRVNMGLDEHDVFYVPIPFFHTNALIVAWPSAASGGAALAIRRKLSISNFWKDVEKYDVSAFIYIGEICRYLMNKPAGPHDRQHRIRKIVGNGLRPDIWKPFKDRFGIPEVYELYGASDGIVSFTNVFNLNCTVGLSISDYVIVRYDVENETPYRNSHGFMEKVEVGEAGLCLGEITEVRPFPGYVNRSKNKEKIIQNVFRPGDRYFNTGDLIRDLGFYHAQFVDRLGDTFRWKGENVSTAELEAILNNLPWIAHSAVYGVALPHTDGKAGMATLKCAMPLDQWDFEAFTGAVTTELPSYAVPLFLRIVREFEKTATHKIKKSVLKKEGIFDLSRPDPIYTLLPGGSAYEKMTPELEQQIKAGAIRF